MEWYDIAKVKCRNETFGDGVMKLCLTARVGGHGKEKQQQFPFGSIQSSHQETIYLGVNLLSSLNL